MSARMEKVREALRWVDFDNLSVKAQDDVAAALAEVEEWETEREYLGGIIKALMPYQERAVLAEAEADRLKAALRMTQGRIGHAAWCECDICAPIRAALVPADRDTTEARDV